MLAAMSRVNLAGARAIVASRAVFGDTTAIASAFRSRLRALDEAPLFDAARAAEDLRELAGRVAAVVELLELESHDAAMLAPWLSSIEVGCGFIARNRAA